MQQFEESKDRSIDCKTQTEGYVEEGTEEELQDYISVPSHNGPLLQLNEKERDPPAEEDVGETDGFDGQS